MAKKPTKRAKSGTFIISEDDFFINYKPQINHIERAKQPKSVANEEVCGWSGCMYETFGEEYNYVCSMHHNKKTTNKVWTIVEGDGDNMVILAGLHRVNRMGFLITKKPWTSEQQEIQIDTTPDE